MDGWKLRISKATAARFIKIVLLGAPAFTSLRISICKTTALVLPLTICTYLCWGWWWGHTRSIGIICLRFFRLPLPWKAQILFGIADGSDCKGKWIFFGLSEIGIRWKDELGGFLFRFWKRTTNKQPSRSLRFNNQEGLLKWPCYSLSLIKRLRCEIVK